MVLHIGTAGVPLSTESRKTLDGITQVKTLGLNAMELEFVRQVYVKSNEEAKEIGAFAKKEGVALSIHAPYFINLNSPDRKTLDASRKRIVDCARVGHYAGARNIVIHSAYYMKMDKNEVYERVKAQYIQLRKELAELGYDDVVLRPELMGKFTQFADIDVLVKMCAEVEGVLPCVDFAHYTAMHPDRNTYEGFCNVLKLIEDTLGRSALKDMHIHFSGINYTEKGERNHLVFDEAEIDWKAMVKSWKEYKIEGIAISESPNIEGDALKAKKYYDSLQ